MMAVRKQRAIVLNGWLRASIGVACGFLLCGVLPAQDLQTKAPVALPPGITGAGLPTRSPVVDFSDLKAAHVNAHKMTAAAGLPAAITPGVPHHITLEEAQQQAAAANPMAHLAQLQVEAARQHRLGAESDYFPKLSSTLTNFHFNKFMGQEVTIQRPIAGGSVTTGLPLLGKDQTLVAVTATQPVTPLFKLHEVVNIARADERLAMAKAGMPVETASNVEKAYYGLLVAQRQLAIAKAKADGLRSKRLVASNGAPPSAMPVDEEQEIGSAKELIMADSKVKEMTVSLNLLLGYPEETELELVAPVTQVEEISLKEAADKAMAANPEVVEAESNVAKAHAASKLSKLDYVPDVAIIGGYTYNGNAAPLLPTDFSFIGIMGSYNLFDFGKREHTIKERNAQVGMAETALELTKAKVAAAVKTSYFQMDRSRQLSALAHRLSDAIPLERVSYARGDTELAASRAKVEVEMFQADLEYRESLAQLKTLMGEE
ncbi:MAG TPA: TolC family protein [Alloacidobacterium sp.]|nr:TolC family protein [Alloacidobacterium sp.]